MSENREADNLTIFSSSAIFLLGAGLLPKAIGLKLQPNPLCFRSQTKIVAMP
jgi:hypothetical protein